MKTVALSKLPWLTALHAFRTCGTWTRGYYFTEAEDCENPEDTKLPIPYGLRSISVVQFANERRRGWEEATDSPQRNPGDAWDERRNARIQKRQPGGDRLLCVESLGWAGGEFGVDQAVDGLRVGYWLEVNGEIQLLNHLQWAEKDTCWSPHGTGSSKSGISMSMAPRYCSKKTCLSPNRTLPPRQHGPSDGKGLERRPTTGCGGRLTAHPATRIVGPPWGGERADRRDRRAVRSVHIENRIPSGGASCPTEFRVWDW
jgi:hypothetical protein